jgi:hypothetical protein
MAETDIGYFGDERLKNGTLLGTNLRATRFVVRKLGDTRAEKTELYRFLSQPEGNDPRVPAC